MSFRDFLVHRAGQRCPTEQQKRFPLSLVKVLETDDELHDAVAQAIEFEREVAARTSARVVRYEELDGLGRVLPLHVDETPSAQLTTTHSEAV
jgi:hypothetical protein